MLNQRNIGHFKKLTNHKENTEGLKEAYKNRDTYLYLKDDTLYIGGTQNIRDVWDDVTKVPFWGDVRKSQRYQDADELLKKNPKVKKLVGHSLGGSVTLELQKQYPERFETTTYGAPVTAFSKGKRYRHSGVLNTDPISMFDFGATTYPISSNNPLRLHGVDPADYYDTVDVQIPYNVNRTSSNNRYRIA